MFGIALTTLMPYAIDAAENLLGDSGGTTGVINPGLCNGSITLAEWVPKWRAAASDQKARVQNAWTVANPNFPFQPETESFLRAVYGGNDCKITSANGQTLYSAFQAIAGAAAAVLPQAGPSTGQQIVQALENAGQAAIAAASQSLSQSAGTSFNNSTPYQIVPDWTMWALAGAGVVAVVLLLRK